MQNSVVQPTAGPHSEADVAANFLTPALQTLLSNCSGPTAPAVGPGPAPMQWQYWLDTSTSPQVLRIFDGTVWVAIGSISGGVFTPASVASAGGNKIEGRLTLTSATPVLASSVAGAPSIYYALYNGNQIALWNGSAFIATLFSELSQALSDTTNSPAAAVANALYDMYGWNKTGVPTLSRGPMWSQTAPVAMTIASPAVVTWTGNNFSDNQPIVFTTTGALPTGVVASTTYYVKASTISGSTFQISAAPGGAAINTSGSQSGTHTAVGGSYTARGTGAGTTELQRIGGLLNNKNAITNGPPAGYGTYLGTIKTNASGTVDFIYGSGAAGGGAASFNIWNCYNRRNVKTGVQDTTVTWTYNSTTIRAANGSATNRISMVLGLSEDSVEAFYAFFGITAGVSGGSVYGGIGLDSTAAYVSGSTVGAVLAITTTANNEPGETLWRGLPGIGFHYLSGIEATANGIGTYAGLSGVQYQGLFVSAEM